MLLWYSSVFTQLKRCCLITAIAQFLLFLFFFLGVSYLSTLLENSDEFVPSYEKYVVLSSSLYMVIPFAFSNVFLFGLFHKNPLILKVYMIGSCINVSVILIVVIGSGIYLAFEGTDYVAYTLISVGLFLELFLFHGIALAFGIRKKYLNPQQKVEESSSPRSSQNSSES